MIYLSIEAGIAGFFGAVSEGVEAAIWTAVKYQNEVVVIMINAPVPEGLEAHP
jgi:hypothetical protein